MPPDTVEHSLKASIEPLLDRFGGAPGQLIPLLQALQNEFGYLPPEALHHIADKTDIPPARISGVARFYPQFRHSPPGRHRIQVCHGTACHVAGAERVSEALARRLELRPGQDTSADRLFTLERVACLGCCSLAPVMLVDDVPYGHLDPTRATESLDRFLEDERNGRHDALRQSAAADPSQTPAPPEDGKPLVEIRTALNSCCVASGGADVHAALLREARRHGARVRVKPVGCTGVCHRVPLVEIASPDGRSRLYADNDPARATRLIRERLRPAGLLPRLRHGLRAGIELLQPPPEESAPRPLPTDDGPGAAFLAPQRRLVTEGAGALDPLSIDDYLRIGGYQALQDAARADDPQSLIDRVARAGLRGRGGAGYPTADKWQRCLDQPAPRIVICNGDEGDPGAFMDRMLLEAYPHRVIEGLALSALAVGAHEGIFYIRGEYPLALQRIQAAIDQATRRGLLGPSLCGTPRKLELRIQQGAGAFVCGEETALIASLEGRRGSPRFRPPYPAERGLDGRPTCVNNVETLANLPWILRHGPEAFTAIGSPGNPGTKVFALAGRVARGGLIEVPMGSTLRQVVEQIGGGARSGRAVKAVQVGGPSGGCIPAALFDTPIDFEALQASGAIMGSGGLVVLDDRSCMVDVARFFLDFTQKESCGKCTLCRIGTRRMLEILEKLCAGEGRPRDLDELERLAHQIGHASLCGLGRSAPNPVLSTLRHFRDEYEAHLQGRCPAGVCPALIRFDVQPHCIGCTLCAQACPVDAIPPLPYQRHAVDHTLCVRCGICEDQCPEDAIVIRSPATPPDEATP